MYKVIKLFADLQDKNHVYNPGDVFPREGFKVTDKRLEELAGRNNKQGVPLIEKIEDETPDAKPEDETPDAKPEDETPAKKSGKKTTAK
jgi:hypothetical protein